MNFLPTTTFSSPVLIWMIVSVWVSLISGGFALLFVFITLYFSKARLKWILGIFSIVCIVSSVGSGFLYESIQANLVPQVKSNLVSNLQQKYVINDVDYNEKDYEQLLGDKLNSKNVSAAVYATSSKSQPIIVFTKDNERVIFTLTQDRATNEPTLSNYPYQAGKISVDEITRK